MIVKDYSFSIGDAPIIIANGPFFDEPADKQWPNLQAATVTLKADLNDSASAQMQAEGSSYTTLFSVNGAVIVPRSVNNTRAQISFVIPQSVTNLLMPGIGTYRYSMSNGTTTLQVGNLVILNF